MSFFWRRVGIIVCGLISVGLPAFASAQAPEGLLIKPAIVEDNVTLGELSEYSVTVRNISTVEKNFYLSTQDILGLDDQGSPVFAREGEQTGYELSSWVSLPTSVVTLKPGETKTVSFSVHVPNRANPGAHFGAIFLTNTPNSPGASGSAISISVATVVNLKIAGDVHEDAQLRQFSTGKIVYGDGTVDFTSKIENLGNVLSRPHGLIQITDMFGRSVGSVEVNASGAPVFPGSSRRYTSVWTNDGFAFGRYQAVASFSYGESESKTISATTSFWILPFKAIAIVLGGVLAVLVGMYLLIRTYIRRKLRDMGIAEGSRDADFYARRYQRSGSRMIVVTLVVFIVCVVFLAALFLVFA